MASAPVTNNSPSTAAAALVWAVVSAAVTTSTFDFAVFAFTSDVLQVEHTRIFLPRSSHASTSKPSLRQMFRFLSSPSMPAPFSNSLSSRRMYMWRIASCCMRSLKVD